MTFDSCRILGNNGVLMLSSVAGGDGKIEVAGDKSIWTSSSEIGHGGDGES